MYKQTSCKVLSFSQGFALLRPSDQKHSLQLCSQTSDKHWNGMEKLKKSENISNENVFHLEIVYNITWNSAEDTEEDHTELQL
jgi:hypothetical protein